MRGREADWDIAERERTREKPRRWQARWGCAGPRRSASRRRDEVAGTGSRRRRERPDSSQTSDASSVWSRRRTPAGCQGNRRRTRPEWRSGRRETRPERRRHRSRTMLTAFCWSTEVRSPAARFRPLPCQRILLPLKLTRRSVVAIFDHESRIVA